ncbi:MAG TPA: glutamine synthetase, partial [Roseibacterium sp.]|nr:glutamine synthetase [Roseibacterium sp.]
KPYPDYAGNGLHTHFSVLDADGNNIFDNGSAEGSETLHHAIAGCLAAMPGSMLVFAPHASSYDRFVPGAHAPTSASWAYENRTTALRIPAGNPTARRIEHRVAGGDINPYLFLAAVLGAALDGIEQGKAPPPATTGNAYKADLPQLPLTWADAIEAFDTSAEIARIFAPELRQNFLATKRQELRYMADLSREEQQELYLDTV